MSPPAPSENTTIRAARATEFALIAELEDLAGARYGEAGLPPDLEGLPPAVIQAAQREGLLWVIEDEGEPPFGFALCQSFPFALHLRELDVHPARMGQGHGRRLIEHVVAEAVARGLPQVTLTTFRDIAWNAPLYQHLGFRTWSDAELPSWLQNIREAENNGDLRHWPRVAMRRVVSAAPA